MKISKIILPIVLSIAFSLPSMAQTQYEYAVISCSPATKYIYITINDIDFIKKEINTKEIEGFFDLRQILKEVNELTEQGWEVYQTTIDGPTRNFIYFLRREKK